MLVRHKIYGLVGVISLALVGSSAVTWLAMKSVRQHLVEMDDVIQKVLEKDIQLLIHIKDIKSNVIQVQQFLTDVSATRGQDGLNDGFAKADEHAKEFMVAAESAMKLAGELGHEEMKQTLQNTVNSFGPYYEMGQKMAQAYVAGGPVLGNQLMESFDGTASKLAGHMDKLAVLIEEEISINSHHVDNMAVGLENETKNLVSQVNMISIAGVIMGMVTILILQRTVVRPLNQVTAPMNRLAEGQVDVEVPYEGRADEIGAIANALVIFRENAREKVRLQEEQELQRQAAEMQKKQSMEKLANDFDASVKHVVDMVAAAATEMDATSKSVSNIADNSRVKLSSLTTEINNTAQNVQSVAASAEQLSAAVNEISSQVARATNITSTAVSEATKADATVQSLSEAAQKIGQVLGIINDIADQINLLALNATIEAARAGDAGKGFAVVASEVKNLANQTTKATSEIVAYIQSMQGATTETVNVIQGIGSTIREINDISTTIAAAVEEQGAATREIASNVNEAARGTDHVSKHASDVTESSVETGRAAGEMTAAAGELSQQAERLRTEVDHFIAKVRSGA